MSTRDSRRAVGIAAGILSVIAIAVGTIIVRTSHSDAHALHATPLPSPVLAPAIVGRDQSGNLITIPSPGRPALVTFFWTHCTDVCPLTASQIAAALDQVGPATAAKIDVIAVSVDPVGDTPGAVTSFLSRHHLTGRMHYIIGSEATLAPMWQQWGIRVLASTTTNPVTHVVTRNVDHSSVLYEVDAKGQEVAAYNNLDAAAVPVAGLAADIRALVG